MKKDHFDIVQEYLNDNPGEKYQDIADSIIADGALNKSHRTIRLYLAQVDKGVVTSIMLRPNRPANVMTQDSSTPVKTNTPIPTDTTSTTDTTKLTKPPKSLAPAVVKPTKVTNTPSSTSSIITDDDDEIYYSLTHSGNTFSVAESMVDSLFCAYSRKGLNYNKPQILSVLNVDRKIFDALVSKHNMSKESEPLGPNFLANNGAEAQHDRIAGLTTDLLEKFSQADSSVAENLVKEYKKKITELVLNANREEELYNTIIDHLPKLEINQYKPDKGYPAPKGTLHVVIGDMHIGLETKVFNSDKARQALARMAYAINRKIVAESYKDVSVLFLGDIMHTVSGVNHANMWKDIEPGHWGAGALIKPFELISEFVSNVHNVSSIYGVGGNHDRLADRKDLEPSDEGGKLVFFMLDNAFKDVSVVWDPDRIQFTKNDITFILLHGDQGQDKRSGQEIAWNLGTNETYNLILVGHTHSRQINKNDDGAGFRKMVCPAFCPTDSYAERLGYQSLPGFILVEEDEDGLPIVTDYPIKY